MNRRDKFILRASRPGPELRAMTSTLGLAVTLAGATAATSFISGILGMAGGMILMGVVLFAFAGTRLSRSVLERMTDASFRTWTRATILAVGAAHLVMGAQGWAA